MTGFRFKQFHIEQDRCAMKVGTDGVLLGAWAAVESATDILDMGCGTGLISLMAAQRTPPSSRICGVELDANAAQQAAENVAASPWADKIRIIHQDMADFSVQCPQKFDLILSNPPYFPPALACANAAREQARYMHQSHACWLAWAQNLLADDGKISLILPVDAAKTLQKSTALCCLKQTDVITKQGKPPQHRLLTFAKQGGKSEQDQLVIYDAQHRYHDDFIRLTRDFYLKF